jgi:hypothetical protein
VVPNSSLGGTHIKIKAKVPSAAIGTRYAVSAAIVCAEMNANPGNNTSNGNFMIADQLYLPLAHKH